MGERLNLPLQDEGQDGGAERRVVTKLLQVAAVLPFGPHRHLDETHNGEESHRQALGHEGEAKPGAQLQRERGHAVSGGHSTQPQYWSQSIDTFGQILLKNKLKFCEFTVDLIP